MKKLLFCFAIVVSASAFSQKQAVINDKNAETRNVGSFHAINVSDGIDLYLSNGNEAVAVSASEQKYREKIMTAVENGILKIWYKSDLNHVLFSGDRKLRAYVSYKQLDMLTAAGGCDIKVDGIIKSDKFGLHVSAGSDFSGKVNVDELKINQHSGSDIDIEGSANKVFIESSSGSDFNGYKLISDVAEIEASGGSDVEITVNKELSAKASGASDINYKGSANVKEKNASGASSISKRS